MYSLKERSGVPSAVPRPILAAKRRRQLSPFFFRMGPVALSITSVLLIGLLAILYLSQVGQAVAENQSLQQTLAQQASIKRQEQDVVYTLSQEQSPTYIAEHARALGLIPVDPKTVSVVIVPTLKPLPSHDEGGWSSQDHSFPAHLSLPLRPLEARPSRQSGVGGTRRNQKAS